MKGVENKFLNKMISTNLISYFGDARLQKIYKKGSIINISSIAGKRGSKNNSVYSATKFAVNGMTQSLAKNLDPKGTCKRSMSCTNQNIRIS